MTDNRDEKAEGVTDALPEASTETPSEPDPFVAPEAKSDDAKREPAAAEPYVRMAPPKAQKPALPPPPDDSLRANVRTIAGAFMVAIFIRVVMFEAFEIEGPSMEPTFLNGDRVIVAKYPFGLFLPFTHDAVTSWGMPNAGDVVIVHSPADNVDIVKRVIGVPGDRIEIRDDIVFRNGEAIRQRELGPCPEGQTTDWTDLCRWYEESTNGRTWTTSANEMDIPQSLSEREVPPGHIFVLGDHRDHSNDSRNPAVGMIPIGRVKGRAQAIYWSSDEEIRWNRIFTGVR